MKFLKTISNFGKLVKFSHTLFALPFALLSVILALAESPFSGAELLRRIIYILICMVSIRNSAMGFNRLIDEKFDKLNPRTANRELPSKKISQKAVWFFTLGFGFLFLLSCYLIDLKIFLLGIPTLSLVLFYSYTKRFTYLCHYVLGLSIGIAPVGAWLVIKDSLELTPIFFFLGLMFHIAGFDILYSTQDYEFDKANSLHSIPVRFGIQKALWISRFTHLLSILFLSLPYFYSNLGGLYLVFVVFIGILFVVEHSLVGPNDLTKVPIAFFHVNISISIVLFLGVLLDKWSLVLETLRRKF